jgi:hypothetical protein
MRQLFLLIIILSTPCCVFGQSFTVDTRVDSLDENYYKLSYSFSDTVLTYEKQDHDLPFPFFMTTPEDKFAVDSVWINEGRTEFEIFLITEDSVYYNFLSNNVLSHDSTLLNQPLISSFDTYPAGEAVQISGTYEKNVEITKSSFQSESDSVSFSVTTLIHLLSYGVQNDERFNVIKDKSNHGGYFEEDGSLISSEEYRTLIKKYGKYSGVIGNWNENTSKNSMDFNDNKPLFYEWGHYGHNEKLPFSTKTVQNDSLILLFVDIVHSPENNYNHVNLVKTYESKSLLNIDSNLSGIEVFLEIFTSVKDYDSNTSPYNISLINYPNPFNPTTQIQYTLPEAVNITISVFNVLGQQVRTLAEGTRSSGAHTITFNATGLPAGMYVVRLESTGQSGTVFTKTKKVMLLK